MDIEVAVTVVEIVQRSVVDQKIEHAADAPEAGQVVNDEVDAHAGRVGLRPCLVDGGVSEVHASYLETMLGQEHRVTSGSTSGSTAEIDGAAGSDPAALD